MRLRSNWQSFLAWFGIVQSVWSRKTGRKSLNRNRRRWSLGVPLGTFSYSRARLPMLEPLEQRQVLTAGLSFDTTPFTIDPTTQNITVHYELSTAAGAAFSIGLYADNGTTQTLLASDSVSNPNLWTVGSHSITLSAPFSAEPQEDFRLNVVLDPGDADVTEEFTGVFLEDSGIVQVFGTAAADGVEIAPSSGSQIRVSLNSVDHYFDEADVTDIHVRTGDGEDNVESFPGVDVPFWGFGGDDNDVLKGTDAESYLDGGDGDDQLFNGLGDLEAVGGDGTDWLAIQSTQSGVYLESVPGGVTLGTTDIESTGTELMGVLLQDGVNVALIDESHLTAMGMTELVLVGGTGTDYLIVHGPDTGPAQPGLQSIQILGLDGSDTLGFYPENITRPAGAYVELYGGDGDDSLIVHQMSPAALPTTTNIFVEGGSGQDTLTMDSISSTLVASNDDEIFLSGGATIPYYNLENISLQTANSYTTSIILLVTDPSLDFEVVGDPEDVLSISRPTGGGAVEATYSDSLETTIFEIDDPEIQVTSQGLKNFNLAFQDVSINNISLDQYYNVITDYYDSVAMEYVYDGTITLAGHAYVPSGFVPDPEQTLIANPNSATLIGGFEESHITIGGTDYLLEYENDVTLVTSESVAGVVVTPSQVILHEHKWTGTAYIMDHENVPRFVTAPDVKTIASGDWSNPTIWSTGVVPAAGDKVRIAADHTVVYDLDSTTEIEAIEVVGTLTYDTTIDTKLVVGTLQVLPSGTLEIGTESAPVGSGVSAILEFADIDLPVGDSGQHGRGLLGFGKVRMHGSNVVKTWLRLDEHLVTGDVKATQTTLTFPLSADLTGWDAGEFVVIPGTKQSWYKEFSLNNTPASQTEVRKILSVATVDVDEGAGEDWRKIVTLDAVDEYSPVALTYDHLGAAETTLGPSGFSPDPLGLTQRSVRGDRATADSEELRPHVGLLSRNVIVRSANPSDSYDDPADISLQRRGHVLFSGRADIDIRYAMFQDLGRTASLREVSAMDDELVPQVLSDATNHIGRYSVHFHHLAGPVDAPGDWQYVFKGNTIQGALKWGVAVHHTHYGLIEDNVAYDVQGAAFVTEDGSEIGNLFNRNFAVKVYGTFIDGDNGSNQATTQAGNFGQGGAGFWFRRAGNDFTNNVAADVTYGHLVITSYYHVHPMMLPNEPGAAGHDNFTQALLVPSGTIDNNEFYGPGEHAVWLAYTAGDNQASGHPSTTFSDLKIWNVQIGVRAYHITDITFDGLWIYGDPERQLRLDAGTMGMSFEVQYESNALTIRDAHIEGMRVGIATPQSTQWVPGQVPTPTVIEDSYLENVTNIRIRPTTDIGRGGQYIQIDNVDFEYMEYGKNAYNINNTVPTPKRNIHMEFSGKQLNYTRPVVVQVTAYDQDPDDNFQLYFEEQAEDAIMPTSEWDWFLRFTRQIGAPPGSHLTNADAYSTYGIATGGIVAPSTYDERPGEIIGLLVPIDDVDDVIRPWTWDPKVVMVTPHDGASFVEQNTYTNPYIHFRYNVEGLIPVGAKVRFSISGGSLSVPKYYDALDPSDDDAFFNLAPGTYTLRGYMADATTNVEISGTATESTFTILAEQINDVTLSPFSVSTEVDDYTTVAHLLLAAGGDFLAGKGVVVTGVSGIQGSWEYLQGSTWTPISGVSSTSAIALPPTARVRYVVDPMYTYSAMDAAPELTFYTWTKTGSGISDFQTGVDLTGNSFIGTVAIDIIQPLLA